MWPPAPFCQRCATYCLIAVTAHAMGWHVSMFTIDSPLNIFLVGEKEAEKVCGGAQQRAGNGS